MNINWELVGLANAPLAKQLDYLANSLEAQAETEADILAAEIKKRAFDGSAQARAILKDRKCTVETPYVSHNNGQLTPDVVKATVPAIKKKHGIDMTYKLYTTDDGEFYVFTLSW